ncbi:hypothetical protein ABZ749_28785, partial [Micromonospora sp. NPDC047753]
QAVGQLTAVPLGHAACGDHLGARSGGGEQGLLSGIGFPYIALRLGIADPTQAGPPHTPRLTTAQVVDTSAVR